MNHYILERLAEKSTWLGIFAMASAFGGMTMLPEQRDAVMMLAIALLGGGHVVSES